LWFPGAEREDGQLWGDILEGSLSIHEQTERVKEFMHLCRQLATWIAPLVGEQAAQLLRQADEMTLNPRMGAIR
jgi:hypothetical protein